MGYFKSWFSEEEPRIPSGWGIDGYRGSVPLTCDHCGIPLVLRDQYIYRYTYKGSTILHNTKECVASLIS